MNITLSRFSVANFRSIYGVQSIDFVSTDNVVALYGQNGAGKSNVLKALNTMIEIMIHSADVGYNLPHIFFHYADEAAARPSTFSIDVSDGKYSMSYSFACNAHEITYEILKVKNNNSSKYRVLFSRRRRELINPSAANYGFSQKLIDRTLSKTLLLTKAYGENNPYAKFVFNAVERIEYASMESGRLESKVATILNADDEVRKCVSAELKKFEPGVKEIQTSSTRVLDSLLSNFTLETDLLRKIAQDKYVNVKIVREYGGISYSEDISDESSGVRAIVTALTMMRFAVNKELMLCIDEFGTFMHPFVVQKLIEYYNGLNPRNKLLITTHQLGLYDYIGRADRVIVKKNSKTGETILEQRKKSTSLRRLREEKKEAEQYFPTLEK